jgi:hypothetical protein
VDHMRVKVLTSLLVAFLKILTAAEKVNIHIA